LKQAVVTDLVKAIREARKGNTFFSPAISNGLMAHYRRRSSEACPQEKRTIC